MSKNVAVFVDVANIFYAAKAAGVDIDYVTLLKSATAGRDFVRAYAYTGLDPENENQRQFHSFLARSGYKVVSKDIRKYGDGRVKANLDIELVVDMMRMAEKLDIAVVVSGDGDFAPAIYAVQQQGVRVEVISFRGNTSSDLIDAADVFIDISGIARVEKGARSGRRVAAEGDLSMTEVPDKESGVTPRRRRREVEEHPERPERVVRSGRRRIAQTPAPSDDQRPAVGGLVALPGEKLSRGLAGVEAPAAVDAVPGRAVESETDDVTLEEGRRRRRRRGGRGRGRGSHPEGEQTDVARPEPDATEFADEVPTLPQHSSFGSVWDRQIGVPTEHPSSRPPRREEAPLDEDLDVELDGEPDVPEYLLAERRQQDRRRDGRSGRGGRGGGYRSALDRERFGIGSRSGYSRSGGRSNKPGHQVTPGRASAHAMAPIEQTPGGDPWSEVPPEVQELLRAELARRQATGAKQAPETRTPADAAVPPRDESPAAPAKPARTTRRRTTSATDTATAAAAAEPEPATAAEEAKPKRATRRRTTTTAATAATVAAEPEPAPASQEAKPKRATRRRTTKAAASEEA